MSVHGGRLERNGLIHMAEPEQPDDGPDDTTVPPFEPDPPPRPAIPLHYSKVRNQTTPRTTFGMRFAIGFFGYIAFCIAWFSGAATGVLDTSTKIGGWLVVTALLLAVSLYLRLRHGYSGIGYGILSVLALALMITGGLVLLVIGICSGKI
jgi:hypothetical protein